MAMTPDVEVRQTVREAAALAHRTPETIRRWVWSGRLAASRDGNRLLVLRDDVLRLAGEADGRGAQRTVTLSDWIDQTTASVRQGTAGATASTLVLDDRRERSDAGH
jgi:excisionase family DNA binding protein